MKRFVEGSERMQGALFPDHLEDFVGEDNTVRVVDAFIDALDLVDLGFEGAVPAATGRPGYHPAVLLKIYVYGYLNRIHSSRRLELEAGRNVELMWLTGRLTPDFKTIADFRRDNGKAIRGVCRQFVVLCRQIGLFGDAVVAIDGSKFKAVNNRDKNFTSAKMQRRIVEINASIERYLAEMDAADLAEPLSTVKVTRLQDRIALLKAQMAELKVIEAEMRRSPDAQVSLTDPDARSMNSRGSGIVGYNVQAVVDADHHLIVAHEVITTGSDRAQLVEMANQARTAIGSEQITVVADRGYFSGRQILACEESEITAYVPKPLTSPARAAGRFDKRHFIYDADRDCYRCPAGEDLAYRCTATEDTMKIRVYWARVCGTCALKSQCTSGTERRVRRWEHEAVLDRMEQRLSAKPEMMLIRRQTVEHAFGTLKAWMGSTHFLTRTLNKVSAEMSLHVLAYNFKRVLKIIGIRPLMTAIRTR
jgi:transposase